MCKFNKIIVIFLFTIIVGAYCPPKIKADSPILLASNTPIHGEEKQEPWTGVDESIVGKYATSFGRPPQDPYINTDRGDLLLCLFTLGGVISGFVIGYNWHKLMKSYK